jgi:hypothetical protein
MIIITSQQVSLDKHNELAPLTITKQLTLNHEYLSRF